MDEQSRNQSIKPGASDVYVEEPLYTRLGQADEGVSDVVTQLLDDASGTVESELEQSFLAIRRSALPSRLPEWFKPGTPLKRPIKTVAVPVHHQLSPGMLWGVFLAGLLLGGALVGQWLLVARFKALSSIFLRSKYKRIYLHLLAEH